MPPREALKDAPVTEQGNGLATDPALPFVDDAGIDTFNGSPSGPSESNIGDAPASADKPVATRESRSIPDLLRGSRVATGVTIASGFFAPFVGAGLARATTIRSTTATYAKAPQPQRVSTNLNPDEVITSIPGNLLPDRPISTRTVSLSSDTLNVQGDCTAPNYYTKWFDSPNGVDTALCDGSPETVSPRTPNNSNYTGFQSELNSQASQIESSIGNASNTQTALSINGALSQYVTASLVCPPPSAADKTYRSITVLSGNTAQLDPCPADPPAAPNVRTYVRYSHQVAQGGLFRLAVAPRGTASDVKVMLMRKSRGLRLQKAGSKPSFQASADNPKLPVWNLGAVGSNTPKEADFTLGVSKNVKRGSKQCVVIGTLATKENASYGTSTTTLDRVCAVVKKRPSPYRNPNTSQGFQNDGCAGSVTNQAYLLLRKAVIHRRSATLAMNQLPLTKDCGGDQTIKVQFLLEGNNHRLQPASRVFTKKVNRGINERHPVHIKLTKPCVHMPDGSPRHWAFKERKIYTRGPDRMTTTGKVTDVEFRSIYGGGNTC